MKRCLLLLLVLVAGVALLVRLVDRQPATVPVDYSMALEQTASGRVPWVSPESEAEKEAFDRFRAFWSDLREDRIREWLPRVYAENVWFNDTVRTITNQSELLEYMLVTASHVQSCRVAVVDIARTGEGYYVRWEMTVVPNGAGEGEVWPSIGISHIRFNAEGKVILHQDYWDSAAGLYEHFPVVGWMIRNIKARL